MEQNTLPPALPRENLEESPAPVKNLLLICALFALFSAAMIYPTLEYGNENGRIMMGVNVPLAVAGIYVAYFLTSAQKVDKRRIILPLCAIAPLSMAFVLFNVAEILVLNVLVLLVIIPLHIAWMSGGNWPDLARGSFLAQVLSDVVARLFAFIGAGFGSMRGREGKGGLKHILAAALGVAVGLPALLVVMVLLAEADARFDDFLVHFRDFSDAEPIMHTLILAFVLLFPSVSFFYSHATGKGLQREQKALGAGIPSASSYAVLAMFNIVLAIFAALQVESLLKPTEIRAYALSQAAHDSFFPMFIAALICYGVQMVCRRFLREEKTALRVLITIMGACLIIMMISAFRDIWAYQQAYGLSRLRIYVLFLIVTFFLALIVTLAGVWRKLKTRALIVGILLASLVALNYINVDRTIAKYNFDLQARTGQAVDLRYLAGLSVDVLPICVENADIFRKQRRFYELESALRWAQEPPADIRLWNYGRALMGKTPVDGGRRASDA